MQHKTLFHGQIKTINKPNAAKNKGYIDTSKY